MTDKQLFKALKRKLKKSIGITSYKKKTQHQKTIMLDLDFVNRGMADFLIIGSWTTEKGFISYVNSFLKMEMALYDYKDKLVYSPGNMELLYKQIKLQHKLEGFKEDFKL